MSENKQYNRFLELAGKLIDDEIDQDGLDELVRLIKTNERFNQELLDQLAIDEWIDQYENERRTGAHFTRQLLATIEAENDKDEFTRKVLERSDSQSTERRQRKIHWLPSALNIAACIAILFVSVFWLLQLNKPNAEGQFSPFEETNHGIAVVTNLVGRLNQNLARVESDDTVAPGFLELDSGFAKLEFYSGAQLSLAGPAKLELIDPSKVVCHYGKLKAKVPLVAQGFTILTPESEVIDLGTEFGVEVTKNGQTEIHVFDGEVEAYDALGTPDSKQLLLAGIGLKIESGDSWQKITAEHDRFSALNEIADLEQDMAEDLFKRWENVNTALKNDDRLIAYWDFVSQSNDPRVLKNRAPSGSNLDGAIVGANWSDGPWPGKQALNFKRPGDQVRVNIPGDFEAITFAAWILVDGIDRSYSSLFLTDGWDFGEFHWQFRHDGILELGINHELEKGDNHISKPFVNLGRLGRWFHIATVLNPETKIVTHYLDGQILSASDISKNVTLSAGPATIGNWNFPVSISPFKVRNLNGQISELMIFKEPLSDEEIRWLALKNDSSSESVVASSQ